MTSDLSPFSQFCCSQAKFPLLGGDWRNSRPLELVMSVNSAWRSLRWKCLWNVHPISLPSRANLFQRIASQVIIWNIYAFASLKKQINHSWLSRSFYKLLSKLSVSVLCMLRGRRLQAMGSQSLLSQSGKMAGGNELRLTGPSVSSEASSVFTNHLFCISV